MMELKANVEDLIRIKDAQEVFINDISSEDFAKAIAHCNTESGFVAGAMWGLARAGMLIVTRCPKLTGINLDEINKGSD